MAIAKNRAVTIVLVFFISPPYELITGVASWYLPQEKLRPQFKSIPAAVECSL
jgi:hypothetical protein